MDLSILLAILILVNSSIFKVEGDGNGLSFEYYKTTCPQVEKIVRDEMSSLTKVDPNIPAHILRLVFHDCQVGGCDASVLLDDKDLKGEMGSPKSFGIVKRELINQIKSKIDQICPQQVSCADILVLAARDAVAVAGGPNMVVPLGRKDSKFPHTKAEADVGLPRNNVNLTIATQVFSKENGITFEETIAILGAHTLGVTHCDGIKERLYIDDPILPPGSEAEFVKELKQKCPKEKLDQPTTFELDPTPTIFDNQYYVNSLKGHGVISFDAEIARDPRSVDIVKKFAKDQQTFFTAFSSAFVKLTALGVLTGDQGVVRKSCNVLA